MEKPLPKYFHPGSMRFHEALTQSGDNLVAADGTTLPSKDVVVLEASDHRDAQGVLAYVGDVVRFTTDNGHIDYVVRRSDYYGNDGSKLEGWHLHPYVQVRNGEQYAVADNRPIEHVGMMAVVDNIFRNYAAYVPKNTHYCYSALRAKPGGTGLEVLACPHWRYATHGMVYCALAQAGCVDNSNGSFEAAVAHYGSEAALEPHDNTMLLWDMVKECGLSQDEEPGAEPA